MHVSRHDGYTRIPEYGVSRLTDCDLACEERVAIAVVAIAVASAAAVARLKLLSHLKLLSPVKLLSPT